MANTTGQGDFTPMTQTNQNDSCTSWNSANVSRRLQPQPNLQAMEQTGSHNTAVQDDQLDNSISESPDTAPLTNPLSTGPSTFMLSDTGKTFYLGHSSNWSFTRRILSITYEHVHRVSLPSTALMFDGKVYMLDWSSASAQPVLPNLDYAIHLINNVKFHCSPMYHLFDEDVFLNGLHAHYREEQTPRGGLVQQLWFIQFMLILAFGKALTSKSSRNNQPPGASFFTHAIHLLPNMTVLWDEPVQAAEVLCCIALYLHCIEHRGSAYNYIGQAVRLAMSHGLHTNLSSHHVENALVPRCRRIWWTILVLDRQMTYLMGLSQSIRDDDVTAPLPEFEGDGFRTAAFAMRTRLSHFIATIDRAIYGPDGRLSSNFLLRTKDTLASMAGLPDELHRQFPLDLNSKRVGVSRLSAHIHLLFHQCIILATRPVLFCFYKIRLETPRSYRHIFNSSHAVESLLRMCLDSSQHVISILECLQGEGLIETFLSYDLEALFISMTNLLAAPVLYQDSGSAWTSWRQRAYAILGEISKCGNLIAQYQQSELRHLEQMIDGLCMAETIEPAQPSRDDGTDVSAVADDGPLGFSVAEDALPSPAADDVLDGNYIGAGFSTAQIMDMVNSIDTEHGEWMSQAFFEA
ncbi:Zn(II)2Cys6 transcription factor, partial [Metarhizium hybridum]